MKKICLIGLFVISILSASTFGVEQEGLISIIPLPEKIEKTGGTFALTSKTLLVASVALQDAAHHDPLGNVGTWFG